MTGGASGIGRALALELARRGATVVVWDLPGQPLDSVAEELANVTGGSHHGYACDVSDAAAVYETAARVRRDVGDVHVLVNNAGVVSGSLLLDIPDEEIVRTFDVNALALFWTVKAFLPAMIEARQGHIVTIASAGGLVGTPRLTDYSASKHAAVGFSESLRLELRRVAPHVVTTVACPYYIGTGMFRGVRTRFRWLLPILETGDVARKVADAISANRRMLVLPSIVRALFPMRLLPPALFDLMLDLLGVSTSMDHFLGRAPAQEGHAAARAPDGRHGTGQALAHGTGAKEST